MEKIKKLIIKLKRLSINFDSTSFDLSFRNKEKNKKRLKILM